MITNNGDKGCREKRIQAFHMREKICPPSFQLSGKFSPVRLLWVFPCAVLMVLILSWIYAQALVAFPTKFILKNAFLTFSFTFVVTFLCYFIVWVGHIRNRWFAAIFSVLISVVGIYSYWVFFEILLTKGTLSPIAMNLLSFLQPGKIYDFALHIAEKQWLVLSFPFQDIIDSEMTKSLWVFEILMVLIMPAICVSLDLKHLVYCEECKCWAKQRVLLNFISIDDDLILHRGLITESMDFGDLIRRSEAGQPFFQISCMYCPNCQELYTVSLSQLFYMNKKGKAPNVQAQELISNQLISKKSFEKLLQIASKFEDKKNTGL